MNESTSLSLSHLFLWPPHSFPPLSFCHWFLFNTHESESFWSSRHNGFAWWRWTGGCVGRSKRMERSRRLIRRSQMFVLKRSMAYASINRSLAAYAHYSIICSDTNLGEIAKEASTWLRTASRNKTTNREGQGYVSSFSARFGLLSSSVKDLTSIFTNTCYHYSPSSPLCLPLHQLPSSQLSYRTRSHLASSHLQPHFQPK